MTKLTKSQIRHRQLKADSEALPKVREKLAEMELRLDAIDGNIYGLLRGILSINNSIHGNSRSSNGYWDADKFLNPLINKICK